MALVYIPAVEKLTISDDAMEVEDPIGCLQSEVLPEDLSLGAIDEMEDRGPSIEHVDVESDRGLVGAYNAQYGTMYIDLMLLFAMIRALPKGTVIWLQRKLAPILAPDMRFTHSEELIGVVQTLRVRPYGNFVLAKIFFILLLLPSYGMAWSLCGEPEIQIVEKLIEPDCPEVKDRFWWGVLIGASVMFSVAMCMKCLFWLVQTVTGKLIRFCGKAWKKQSLVERHEFNLTDLVESKVRNGCDYRYTSKRNGYDVALFTCNEAEIEVMLPPSVDYTRQNECAVSGSVMRDFSKPKCVIEVWSNNVMVGLGFRLGDAIVTAAHNVLSCKDHVEFKANGVTIPVSTAPMMDKDNDVAVFPATPMAFSSAGVGKAQIMKRPARNTPVYSVGRNATGTGWNKADGVISSLQGNQLIYTCSTMRGYSGGPIFSGNHVVAMHLRANGNSNAGLMAMLLTLDESSADHMRLNAAEMFGIAEYEAPLGIKLKTYEDALTVEGRFKTRAWSEIVEDEDESAIPALTKRKNQSIDAAAQLNECRRILETIQKTIPVFEDLVDQKVQGNGPRR